MSVLRTFADMRVVVVVLVAVGVGLALIAPNMISSAIPLLIVAACPISMVVMMRSMGSHESSPSVGADRSQGRRGQLQDQIAAIQLERLQLERELARLDDAHDRVTGDLQGPAAPADVQVRPR